MNEYEKQLQSAAEKQVPVLESWDMGNDPEHEPIDGLYINGTVALSSDLKTTAEKAVILAEELAHHDLTVGDILDQRDAANRRQEQKARTLAYNRMIGIAGIIDSIEHGCQSRYEASEYLGVPEGFLQEAIERYQEIYGPAFASQISRPDDTPASAPSDAVIKSVTTNEPPALTADEIQDAIARLRKRRKGLKKQWTTLQNKALRKERNGYDFFSAEENRRLDPDRK